MCTDGKGHYVAVLPDEEQDVQLAYGDGKRFVQVAPRALGAHRLPLPRAALLQQDDELLVPRATTCACTRRWSWTRRRRPARCAAARGPSRSRWSSPRRPRTWWEGEIEPNPQKYVPYALLRDQQGRYYLVEQGFQPSEQRNFRVSIGPKGNLQPQKMKDIVSDSEGEIFSTKKGELRLVVDKRGDLDVDREQEEDRAALGARRREPAAHLQRAGGLHRGPPGHARVTTSDAGLECPRFTSLFGGSRHEAVVRVGVLSGVRGAGVRAGGGWPSRSRSSAPR